MDGPWEAYQADSGGARGPWEAYAPAKAPKDSNILKDIGLGLVRGASNIGNTLIAPGDYLTDLEKGQDLGVSRKSRLDKQKEFFDKFADTDSLAYKGGELASEIAGTGGVGKALAKVGIAKVAPKLAAAIESGGFSLGKEVNEGSKIANAVTRISGGGITGGASAGLVDPESVGTGAAIGAALPGAVKIAGAAGKALAPKKASEEVVNLFNRAKELGIDVPADRIANSRPLNAIASSLNYVPLAGRAGTEERMLSQFNRALSRTFGQDTDNVTGALKKANLELGTKFEQTLSHNGVKVDDAFMDDMVKNMQKAVDELPEAEARIIGKQIDNILEKGATTGMLDGQAAYNIKKTLDRIGGRNTNEAYYARELKKSLMGALDRSLGPRQAAEFKQLRQQYGNMLDLEGLAQRGGEGGVSIGKLANLGRTNNKDLDELADIAAQFLKTRENPHGAAQRVGLGLLGATVGTATGSLPLIALGMAGGRATNALLNSQMMKDAMTKTGGKNKLMKLLESAPTRSLAYATSTNP